MSSRRRTARSTRTTTPSTRSSPRWSEGVMVWMMTGLLKELDLAFGPIDDIVAVWDVEKARDAAWVRARVIWSLRGVPPLRDADQAMNDRATGFAGRALLTPVGLVG